MCVWHQVHVKIGGQLAGIYSLLCLCGFWGPIQNYSIVWITGVFVFVFVFEIHSSNKGHLNWFPILIIIIETTLSTTI